MSGDLLAIIKAAAAMGAAEAVGRMHPEEDRISQRKAEAMFGRAFLHRNRSRLNVCYNGNRREYSRAECEQVRYSESVAGIIARADDYLFEQQLKKSRNGQEKTNR